MCGWRPADVHSEQYFCTTTTEVFDEVDMGDCDTQRRAEKKNSTGDRRRKPAAHGALNWALKMWDGNGITHMGRRGFQEH